MKTIVNSGVIVQAYNNNIVSIRMDGKEKILFSRGIGFGKKFGDKIKEGTEVEKIFVIEDQDNLRNFKQVVEKVDEDFLTMCERIIILISEELNEELDERIHIGLTDHLYYAIKRIKNNEIIDNPFLMEIKVLYQREYILAKKAAKILNNEMDIMIPDDEIGMIALHIHSARNSGNLSNTIKNAYLINMIIEYVEKKLKIKIDKNSLDYARFATHVRFAIRRMLVDSPVKNDFIREIKCKYRLSYSISKDVSKILEKRLEKNVSEDEIAYLAMHIERFRVSTIKNN
ncbi:BglG family transcription antiterminator [Clostridium weizhouense]|uniref:PRD domain-containing protein n=1 Tax=Clostridium weizhouense TaxID=2859781 RepID=A0ABS7AKA0_9CLOT|nr:PRD domain-containing protein [Clostridium weizhouense]MBW6409071.1 PRD domain-containing protein [Clostridium weizhouense]